MKLTPEEVRAAAIAEAFMTLVIKLTVATDEELSAAVTFINKHDGYEAAAKLARLAGHDGVYGLIPPEDQI